MKHTITERYLAALLKHNSPKWWMYFRAWDVAQKVAEPADNFTLVDTYIRGMTDAPSTVRIDDRLQSGAVPPDDVAET